MADSIRLIGLGLALSLVASTVCAQESDRWEHALAVYLWFADIRGTTQLGTDVEVDFSDLVDNLEMAFMGAYQARRGKWSLLGDAIYLDVGKSESFELSTPGPLPIVVPVDTDIDLEGWVVNLQAGYNLYSNDGSLTDFVFGARYLDLATETSIFFDTQLPPEGIEREGSSSEKVWDGIVGIKGRAQLGERWYVPYYIDIGTGESDFTWQGMIGINFQAAKWADIALAYRHLEWQLDKPLLDDISFGGPVLGVVFRF